jgi:uncharacterized protein involved in oxidation of intracellular sulfur
MKTLFILNDPPYGTERVYNALRLAHALQKKRAADRGYHLPYGGLGRWRQSRPKDARRYYNVERMLKRVITGNGKVLLCGTCMDARGFDDPALMAGAQRSTMDELAAATAAADKILVF